MHLCEEEPGRPPGIRSLIKIRDGGPPTSAHSFILIPLILKSKLPVRTVRALISTWGWIWRVVAARRRWWTPVKAVRRWRGTAWVIRIWRRRWRTSIVTIGEGRWSGVVIAIAWRGHSIRRWSVIRHRRWPCMTTALWAVSRIQVLSKRVRPLICIVDMPAAATSSISS